METKTLKLVIIGSGPAGLTAAIYASRSNLNPLIIEGDQPGGQLMTTTYVENWPGEKSILGPKLISKMREHAKSFGTDFLSETITKVDFSSKPFKLTTNKNQILNSHAVIIATGATPKKLGCKGEEKYWNKGVNTCAVCDGAFYKDKKIIIVGGGDTAMESALFMTNFTDDITIVHILSAFTASDIMQQRVLDNPKIKVIYNSTVTEISGNDDHVTGVTVSNQKTGDKQQLETAAVFIAIGLTPNTQIFKNQLEMTDYGYIILKDHTETSVKGVFAAGDVSDPRYKQAITSAGAGCAASLDAEKYISSVLNNKN